MQERVSNITSRRLLAALTGLVLCLALALTALPAARATPPSAGRNASVGGPARHDPPSHSTLRAAAAIKDKITFGKSTLRGGRQAGRIARGAMSKSGKTLNYAKAKALGGKTKWRRQFAAGFYWQGGRITQISDAELAEVKKLMPPSPAVIAQREPNCRGANKTVVVRHDRERRIVDTYFDSCETIDLITARGQAGLVACGIGAGTAGLVNLVKKIPKLKEAIYLMAAMCAFFAQNELSKLEDAVAKSTLNALIVRSDGTYHRAPKGTSTYYTTVRYYPQ